MRALAGSAPRSRMPVRSLRCSAGAFASTAQPALVAVRVWADVGGVALMPATVIVGLQWGDEGKGKMTDFLAEQVAMVVRYQGGDNAGHTVVKGNEVFKLRLTPSGVLYPHITSVIGNGVVVNPLTLIDELDMLTSRGIDVSRVRVSRSAHVIMPYHVALDLGQRGPPGGRRRSGRRGGGSGRPTATAPGGSGCGWRTCSIAASCASGSRGSCRTRTCCSARWAAAASSSSRSSSWRVGWGERLRHHLDDTTWLVQGALARGEHVLLEGAQGTLLDLDHGSYPYRHLVEPGRRRRLHRRRDRAAPGRRGHRRRSRPTRPGSAPGPYPDRAARRDRRRYRRSAATSSAP